MHHRHGEDGTTGIIEREKTANPYTVDMEKTANPYTVDIEKTANPYTIDMEKIVQLASWRGRNGYLCDVALCTRGGGGGGGGSGVAI